MASNSATHIPSQQSVKAYVDAQTTDETAEGSSNLYYTDARVGTYISGNRTYGNITTTGYLAGPSTFTIDPAAVGDNTGTLVIAGNLQVDGTTTTINSTTLTVDDKLVTLASGSANAGAANGAGIEVDISGATNPSILYDSTNDEWDFNKNVNVTGTVTATDLLIDTDVIVTDSTNDRVGINKTSPATTLDVGGSIYFSSILRGTSDGSESSPTIQPGNDGDTGLFRPTTNTIGFTTAGSEAMRIDSSGNVGIGGASDGASLQVNRASTSYIDIKSDNSLRMRMYGDSNQAILVSEGVPLIFKYGSTEAMRIANGGDINFYEDTGTTAKLFWDASAERLGIGTTSPSEKLELGEGSSTNRIKIDSPTKAHYIGYDGSDDALQIASQSFVKFQSGGSFLEVMRIDSSGNVTINSSGTIPTGVLLGKQLVVGSSNGSEVIAFREGTSVAVGDKVGAFLIGTSDTDGTEDHFVGMWGKTSSTNGSQDLHFAAGRSGYEGDSPQMTLASSGNLSIGPGTQTGNGDANITIREGDAFAGFDLKSTRTAGNIGGLRFYDTSSDSVPKAQFLAEIDGSYNFYNGTNGAERRLKISSDGKISTTTANNFGDVGTGGLHLYGSAETVLDIDGSYGSHAIRFNDNGSLRAIMGFSNGSTIATNNVADGDFVLRAETGHSILFANSGSPGFGMDTNGTIVANLQASSDTTARIGIKIRGGTSSDDAEGGQGGATNTFETNMNRQILLQYRNGSAMYAHAIHSRHNSGARGGNTIDFYIHDGANQTSSALPNKRAFSIHNKAIELVPITTTERDAFGTQNRAYDGMLMYNSTDNKYQGRVNGTWVNLKTEDDYPVTSGLYYRYTGDSYTYNGTSNTPTWNDASGNSRNISSTSTSNGGGFWGRTTSGSGWPTLVTNSANTNGANNQFSAVRFTTAQGLALPDDSNIASNAASGFSFAFVARYSGSTRERILQGGPSSVNNLIGFWDGNRGVFYDGSWLIGPGSQHSTDQDDWCIIVMRSTFLTSKTKDNNSGNFVETTLTHNYSNANYSASSFRYGINAGTYADSPFGGLTSEQSTCDIAEIAFFNRNLTDTEIDSVQSFLETKYGI